MKLSKKCPDELFKQLKSYIDENGYQLENKDWEESMWKIIDKYYNKHPPSKICSWDGCEKERIQFCSNLAGEIVYNYCQEHLDWHQKHVRSFKIIG